VSALPETDLRLHDGPWTEEEYLALPADGTRTELLDGGLLVNPSPTVRHQRLALRLSLALEALRPPGMEVLETINVRAGQGRILIPDVVVLATAIDDAKVVDAADVALVVEIVSPGSIAADRAIKPRLYGDAGIGTYVRIELSKSEPEATVLTLEGGRYRSFGPADRVLRLREPFPVDIDLVALLAADRPTPG
jgi:Uma2 family endonuclease